MTKPVASLSKRANWIWRILLPKPNISSSRRRRWKESGFRVKRRKRADSKTFKRKRIGIIMTKPKERPNDSKDTRSFQPKSGFSNHWHLKNQNSDGNKGQMKQ